MAFGWAIFCLSAASALHRAWFSRVTLLRETQVCPNSSAGCDECADNVIISARDGAKLCGCWYGSAETGNPAGVVVLLHDFRGERGDMAPLIPHYRKNGWLVLNADLRAHGDSGGKWTTLGVREAEDLNAWVEWIGLRVIGLPVIAHGRGIGAATAVRLALSPKKKQGTEPFAAIIAEGARFDGSAGYLSHIDRIIQPGALSAGVRFFSSVISLIRGGVSLGSMAIASPESLATRIPIPFVLFEKGEDDYNDTDNGNLGKISDFLGRFT